MNALEQKKFGFACAALVDRVLNAASPRFEGYDERMYDTALNEALFYTYYVYREARRLGLVPKLWEPTSDLWVERGIPR